MARRTRSPQEKKELSYAKDTRNTVAESRARARKGIARRRAKAHRAFRRAEAQALAAAAEPDADVFVARTGRRSWKKLPDAPLGEHLALRLESREAGEMNDGDRRSDLLAAGRKRARVRPLWAMGGFYRGQNRTRCLAAAEARDGAETPSTAP